MKETYFDNAATTPVSDEVYAELMDKYKNVYGNASTLYGLGRESKAVMEDARDVIAKSINANPDEIIFTSGGLKVIILRSPRRQWPENHWGTTSSPQPLSTKPF